MTHVAERMHQVFAPVDCAWKGKGSNLLVKRTVDMAVNQHLDKSLFHSFNLSVGKCLTD